MEEAQAAFNAAAEAAWDVYYKATAPALADLQRARAARNKAAAKVEAAYAKARAALDKAKATADDAAAAAWAVYDKATAPARAARDMAIDQARSTTEE